MLSLSIVAQALLHLVVASCFGSYDIDISGGLGRRFDGIGGLSGGGVSSLLVTRMYFRCF